MVDMGDPCDEDLETHWAEVRAALIAGEDSGEPEPFDFDSFITLKKVSTAQ